MNVSSSNYDDYYRRNYLTNSMVNILQQLADRMLQAYDRSSASISGGESI